MGVPMLACATEKRGADVYKAARRLCFGVRREVDPQRARTKAKLTHVVLGIVEDTMLQSARKALMRQQGRAVGPFCNP